MAEKAPKPVPEGMHTVTPTLWFGGACKEALAFYAKAFGAEPMGPVVASPDGKLVWHAMLRIGDSPVMFGDAMPGKGGEHGPERGGPTASLWLYVEDCHALFDRAVKAGCEVLAPLDDAFWGDRFGKVKDPFGHVWAIATHVWVYTPQEMKQREDAAIKAKK